MTQIKDIKNPDAVFELLLENPSVLASAISALSPSELNEVLLSVSRHISSASPQLVEAIIAHPSMIAHADRALVLTIIADHLSLGVGHNKKSPFLKHRQIFHHLKMAKHLLLVSRTVVLTGLTGFHRDGSVSTQ